MVIEGSLGVNFPIKTTWTDEKHRSKSEEKAKEEKRSKEQVRETGDACARKGRKVAKHCVFPLVCGSGGWKIRLAKAAGAEPGRQLRDETLHANVARSTFPSQIEKHSNQFWTLR